LKAKKYVVIKVNNVSTVNQLAATHADAIHGILDYLEPRFKGPSSSPNPRPATRCKASSNSATTAWPPSGARKKWQLIDLNREAKFKAIPLIDYDLHAVSTRLAARLFDPTPTS